MKYKFPIIKTIDDVLPHIKGRDEFGVTDKGEYTVINYHVQFPDTFSREHEGWEVRRECRGLIFDETGLLISRPFHKFFNVNEMEEVHETNIPLHEKHILMEKMDGSMIRPFLVGDYIRLGTKMGVTDVAVKAEKVATEELFGYMSIDLFLGRTPLFEYVGPENRIVLDYDVSELVYLGTRINETGEYVYDKLCPAKHVPIHQIDGIGDMKGFIEGARCRKDREGDILFFPGFGGMVKIKNDWYVQLHKILDQIRAWRHVADKMYKAEIDDVLPKLSEDDRRTITEFMSDLRFAERNMIDHIQTVVDSVKAEYGLDKKRIALEYVNTLDKHDAWIGKFIFAAIDGKGVCDQLVRDKIVSMTGSQTKFNECLAWLGMEKYID